MNDVSIRTALPADVPAITAIYNHYVRTSTATFDTEEKSVEDRVEWLTQHVGAYPALVAERDGGVVAWGTLSAWARRRAYRHTAEISVYVAPDATARGVGPVLANALIARAREVGHHAVVSQIVHENEASLKMASRLGFEHAGTLREVGRKFDRWLDLVLMELVLDADSGQTSPAEKPRGARVERGSEWGTGS